MTLRRLGRTVAALSVGAAVWVGAPAWANASAVLAVSQLPATAAGFVGDPTTARCSPRFGGGPHADKDVWRFGLTSPGADRPVDPSADLPGAPGSGSDPQGGSAGSFVSLTLTFLRPGGGSQVSTIDAESGDNDGDGDGDGDDIVGVGIDTTGTGGAWIITESGWTLTGGTAEINGGAQVFVLAQTCPAINTGEATESGDATLGAGEARASASTTPASAPVSLRKMGVTPSAASLPALVSRAKQAPRLANPVPTAPPALAARASATLPSTGLDVAGMLTLGATMVVAGVLLLIVRRRHERRAASPVFAADPDDVRRPTIVLRRLT